MANHLQMAKVNAILTLHARGWSYRRIARELRVDRGTVTDKELQRHGLRFVRYADDCNIFVRSEKPAILPETVRASRALAVMTVVCPGLRGINLARIGCFGGTGIFLKPRFFFFPMIADIIKLDSFTIRGRLVPLNNGYCCFNFSIDNDMTKHTFRADVVGAPRIIQHIPFDSPYNRVLQRIEADLRPYANAFIIGLPQRESQEQYSLAVQYFRINDCDWHYGKGIEQIDWRVQGFFDF